MAKPKYQQLAASLRAHIATGNLKDGDKLSTEKELMERYKVSRQTVRHAISLMESEGCVKSRQGSGTFVVGISRAASNGLNQIAVISTYISDYIFPSIIRGIETVLSENGYTLLLKVTNNQIGLERAVLMSLIESPPDGLIVEGSKTALPNPNLYFYDKLQELHVPMVFMHATYPKLSNPVCVIADDYRGGYAAARYLADKGHRRIACIFKSTDVQSLERYSGFLSCITDRNMSYSDKHMLWFQDNEQLNLLLSTEGSLDYFRDCTAIVCYNDQVACMMIRYLNQYGYSIPDDMSIISFDDSVYASNVLPNLTSFSHPKELLGIEAAKKVMNMVNGIKEASTVLPWRLVERGSVADLNESK